MSYEFWEQRWKTGKIGFHEGAPNDLLVAHVGRIEGKRPACIFVPLAGKAIDMRWLAERGHEVVGVEIVWEAVTAFFDEWQVEPTMETKGPHRALSANGVTLVCADVFDLAPAGLGRFDVVYDRAALVAVEPSERVRYVETCRGFVAEGGVTLLVTFAYDQSKTEGPPWAIDEPAVRELYAGQAIERLETRSVTPSARLVEAGIPSIEESVYLITAASSPT